MADSELLTQLGAVLFVFALLGAVVYLLGRRGGRLLPTLPLRSRSSRHLEVMDRLYLTPHHSLHVVRVGKRKLLLTVHPGGCTVVENMPVDIPDPVAEVRQ